MMLEQVIESARQAAYPAVTTTFRDVPWNAPAFYTARAFLPSELAAASGTGGKGRWKRNTVCRRKRAAPCA